MELQACLEAFSLRLPQTMNIFFHFPPEVSAAQPTSRVPNKTTNSIRGCPRVKPGEPDIACVTNCTAPQTVWFLLDAVFQRLNHIIHWHAHQCPRGPRGSSDGVSGCPSQATISTPIKQYKLCPHVQLDDGSGNMSTNIREGLAFIDFLNYVYKW